MRGKLAFDKSCEITGGVAGVLVDKTSHFYSLNGFCPNCYTDVSKPCRKELLFNFSL